MKCNAFNKLLRSDAKKIEEYCQARVAELLEPLLDDAKERWLKLSCIAMAKTLNCTEEQMICLLGNYKNIYRSIHRMQDTIDIDQYLNEQIESIFPDGFPNEWIKQFRRTEKEEDRQKTF